MAAKFIKKQNLVIVTETYKANDGSDKKKYQRIGSLITMEADDGRQYQFGEIFYPKANFSVYDIKPREDKEPIHQRAEVPTIQQDEPSAKIEQKQDEINIKDIPF